MDHQTITRDGKRFVLVPLEDYRRWADGDQMPPFPPVDKHGNSNAIEFARAAIARRLITDRRRAGLSQQRLARMAGVRQETISRIESGKQTATVRVIDKLEKAIRKAASTGKHRKAS